VCVCVMGVCVCVFIFIFIVIFICCRFKQKTEVQVIFLSPFTICSSCKRKYVVCLFVDEETNGSYPFANEISGLNRLNGLNGLVHLELLDSLVRCVVF
jgi:hypothetical protein